MKVLLSWLREFCPTDLPPKDLANRLTAQGVKVEGVTRPWERLSGVVAARVLEVRDHPNSDKLCLARVSHGSGEREVVVGVRNMKPGDLVPLAGPGTTVPGLLEPLSARKIRGVVSDGMLCSPRELGVGPEHTGILILPSDTPLGADLRDHFGLDDVLFDIEVKSNRPDLMSVFGVAREASAATGVPLLSPDTSVDEGGEKAREVASVEIVDLERCPRYLARVIRGVAIGPAPVRAQARLFVCGMRPLSNVVDATNYALLEMGHPLHPFDLARLDGSSIVARRAADGERLVTLDAVERTLSADDLVIADLARSVALAGVMGSAASEVSPSTTDVLLESAYFEPHGIRRTARRLQLQTEASARFERGADPEAIDRAADRAARLIAEWAGGTVMAGVVEAGETPPRRRLELRPARASLLLGHPVTAEEAAEAFSRLGMRTTRSTAGKELEVEIPGYRPDLEREVDLIEEVARVQGYDRVSSALPGVRRAGGVAPGYRFRGRVRRSLVRAGLRESSSYSFGSEADLALTGHREGVRVANPLSAEEAFLRASLLPGLFRAVAYNLARGARGAALFETGHVFTPRGSEEHPLEERVVVAGAMGGVASFGYPDHRREFDFSDGKGVVEGLLDDLGITGWTLVEPAGPPFHPGRSAVVMVGDRSAGSVGEVHPKTAERLDVPARTELFELDLATLEEEASGRLVFREISRFPPIHRDLAFVLDQAIPAGAVGEAIREAGGGLVEEVVLFDLFRGGPVPAGKKSLAFSVEFRAADRTLTDQEADAAVAAVVRRVGTEFGGELRATE